MARICMLLSRKKWWEMRMFYRQAPALARAGHEVIYMADDPGQKVTDLFAMRPLTTRQRKLARFAGCLNLLPTVLKCRPDVLHMAGIEQLPLGLVLKLFTGIKVVYDCREDTPSAMLQNRPRIPRFARWAFYCWARLIEYLADRLLDGIVVADPALYRLHYGAPAEKKMIFFNTPLLSRFSRDYKPLVERPYDVVFLGNMTPRTGVATVTEAVGLLKQRGKRVSLLLLGELDAWVKEPVENLIKQYDIADQVTYTGWLKHKDIPGLLAQAKIGVSPLWDIQKFRHNLSCKTFEYMACGMPCVCSDLPPQHLHIRHGHNGLFCKPGNTEELANALEILLNDLGLAQAMGDRGREDMEREWNAEKSQEELIRFYERILGKSRPD